MNAVANVKRWMPVFINSNNRSSGNVEDCVISIEGLGRNEVDENYEILLNEFRMTMDVPNINSYSRSLTTSEGVLNIPKGNYNANQLISELVMLGITTTYDGIAEKFTFIGVSHTIGTTSLIGTTAQAMMLNEYQADLFGLSSGVSYQLSPPLTSEKVINLNYPKQIKISTGIPLESFNSWSQNSNIIDIAFPDVSFGSEYIHTNYYPVSTRINQIRDIPLQLSDEYNNPLVDKDTDYQMKLLFSTNQS